MICLTLSELINLIGDIENTPELIDSLNELKPDWKESFPIPIDKSNAETLVEHWLQVAAHVEKAKRKKQSSKIGYDTFLEFDTKKQNCSLTTEVRIPDRFSFDAKDPKSGSVEIQVTEGNSIVKSLSNVIATVSSSDPIRLTLRLQAPPLKIIHTDLRNDLQIHVTRNGEKIYSRVLVAALHSDESAIHKFSFTDQNGKWALHGSVSLYTNAPHVGFLCGTGAQSLTETTDSRSVTLTGSSNLLNWFESSRELRFLCDESRIRLVPQSDAEFGHDHKLRGRRLDFVSTPSQTFVGFPEYKAPDNAAVHSFKINQMDYNEWPESMPPGLYAVDVIDDDGFTLFSERFAVLSEHFQILQKASTSAASPINELTILGCSTSIRVSVDDVPVPTEAGSTNPTWNIPLKTDGSAANKIDCNLIDRQFNSICMIRLPAIYEGVQVIDAEGRVIESKSLSFVVSQLTGFNLFLSAAGFRRNQETQFFLVFRISIGSDSVTVKKSFVVKDTPITLNMGAYESLCNELFGLDENVELLRLSVETDMNLKNIHIHRHAGALDVVDHHLVVLDHSGRRVDEDVNIEYLDLTDEDLVWKSIDHLTDDNIKTGGIICRAYEKTGMPFRYVTIRPDNDSEDEDQKPDSHFSLLPYDLKYPHWEHLDNLVKLLKDVPLSAATDFKILEQDDLLAAIFVLRSITPLPTAMRLQSELQINWFLTPIQTWRLAFERYIAYIQDEFEEKMVRDVLINNRLELVLGMINVNIPTEFQLFDPRVDLRALPAFPPEVILKNIYGDLIRDYGERRDWPNNLDTELLAWSKTVDNFGWDNWGTPNRVTAALAPIFLAYVSAGMIEWDSLGADKIKVIEMIWAVRDFCDTEWFFPAHACVMTYLCRGIG
jgi:hypothetical protein